MAEEYLMDDAEICVAAFGIAARVAKNAIDRGAPIRASKVGMVRPITLWPFPKAAMARAAGHCRALPLVEIEHGSDGGRHPAWPSECQPSRGAVQPRRRHHSRRLEEVLQAHLWKSLPERKVPTNGIVFQKPHALTDAPLHYCPGCTHGIIHRLVARGPGRAGRRGQDHRRRRRWAARSCAYNYFNCDMVEAAHGRAPAVATGLKRAHPGQPSSSPTRATATWPPSARRRPSTPPRAARTSPSSSSTTPFTA